MKDSSEVLSILHNEVEAYYRDEHRLLAAVVAVAVYGRYWRYDDAYVKRTDGVYRHWFQVVGSWDRFQKVDQKLHWHVHALVKAARPDR